MTGMVVSPGGAQAPSGPATAAPSAPAATAPASKSFADMAYTTAAPQAISYQYLDPLTTSVTAAAQKQDTFLAGIGQSFMDNYSKGVLSQPMMSYIDHQTNSSINQLTQTYHNLGMSTDSPQYQQAVAQIKQQGVNVVAQNLQQEFQDAIGAFNIDESLLNYVSTMNQTIYSGRSSINVANTYVSAQNLQATMSLIGDVAHGIGMLGSNAAPDTTPGGTPFASQIDWQPLDIPPPIDPIAAIGGIG